MAQTITLNALSISPRYFTEGDTVTVTMTIKNNSSKQTVVFLIPDLILDENIGSLTRVRLVDWAGLNISLGTGKTGTFTATGVCQDSVSSSGNKVSEACSYMESNSIRCLDSNNMYFGLSAYFSGTDTDGVILFSTELNSMLGGTIGLLDKHLPGKLTRCILQRCRQEGTSYVADDEGTYIRSNIAFTLASGYDGSNVPTKRIVITGDGGTSKTISVSAAQLDNMISTSGYEEVGAGGLITGTYSNGENLSFKFEFGDSYEMMTFTVTVPRAFANLHLSGCKSGGVAIGKFSAATEGHPLFECVYPAVFSGGVDFGLTWESPTLASNVTSPNEDNFGNGALRVGREGNHVYVCGGVKMRSATTSVLIATLPSGYGTASGNVYFLRACSGARVARLFVTSDGKLYLEWVYTFGSSSKYVADLWVDCNFDYWKE